MRTNPGQPPHLEQGSASPQSLPVGKGTRYDKHRTQYIMSIMVEHRILTAVEHNISYKTHSCSKGAQLSLLVLTEHGEAEDFTSS